MASRGERLEELKTGGEGLLEDIREIVRQEVGRALCGGVFAAPALPETDGRPVLSGDLRYFRLPEILHMVSMQSLTGRLSMSHEGRSVDVYFRDGWIAYATGETRSPKEQLGSMLVSMGRLTKGALDDALARSASESKFGRLGRVLIDDGHVSADDIRTALTKQTERSVYKAMAWADGTFEFELCGLPEFVEEIPLNIKVEGMILEGVRRIGEIRAFTEKITSLGMVFAKPEYTQGEVDAMGLKPEERTVLDIVDGRRDVTELMRISGMEEFTLLRALYALFSAGIIKKAGTARKEARTQYL